MWILQSDCLIHLEKNWLYLITWVGIVTSPTYSVANNKFKYNVVLRNNYSVTMNTSIFVFGGSAPTTNRNNEMFITPSGKV